MVNGEYPVYKTKEDRDAVMALYQEFLINWKVPYREIDVDTSFGKTHVIRTGTGKNKRNFVIISGNGSNSSIIPPILLRDYQDFNIFLIDVPGQPGKSRPTKLPKNGKEFSDWLNESFKALHIDKASVLGLSLGGWMLQSFLNYHPDRIEKFISWAYPYFEKKPFRLLSVLSIVTSFAYHYISGGYEGVLTYMNGGHPLKNQEYENLWRKFIVYSTKYSDSSTFDVDIIPEKNIKEISKPVLVIFGGKDFMLGDAKEAQKYISKINNPNIHFELIPDEGHILLNKPEYWMKLVNDFLK
jgi:pimeloyl-ACP methyl ester carboxylesterase